VAWIEQDRHYGANREFLLATKILRSSLRWNDEYLADAENIYQALARFFRHLCHGNRYSACVLTTYAGSRG
jgi:hypothetical protein